MRGKIKKWLELRGFGFIEPDDGGDVFCHIKSVIGLERGRDPSIGAHVEFEKIKANDGRIQAVGVKLLGDDDA